MEEADFLEPGAPIATEEVVAHMSLFYDSIRERGPRTMTSEYSSAVARRYVDFKSPLAAYAKIPRPYVIVQRINLGLFAILGEMNATADWRGHLRGDLAVRPGAAVHADGRGGSAMARVA